MELHPGIYFRTSPSGRGAVVIGGPEVWEIVRDVLSARSRQPDLPEGEVLEMVSAHTGVPRQQLEIAIRYWSDFPGEIARRIADDEQAYEDLLRQLASRHSLTGT